MCHDLSLGFTTKARCGLGVQLKNHIHIPGSVGECEGMSPHTPKWIPTLGVGISMDFLEYLESGLRGQNSLD